MFFTINDSHKLVGSETPRGKKEGTLWDTHDGANQEQEDPPNRYRRSGTIIMKTSAETSPSDSPRTGKEVTPGVRQIGRKPRWMGHDQVTVETAPKYPEFRSNLFSNNSNGMSRNASPKAVGEQTSDQSSMILLGEDTKNKFLRPVSQPSNTS